jgi:F0F1-type ATP synthase membrane subunit a
MAGHTLMKILVLFAWLMLLKLSIWIYSAIIILFVIFLITLLEIGIALVQSYIFCTLVIIYLNTYFESH